MGSVAYTNPDTSVQNANITNLYDYSMHSPLKSEASGLHKRRPGLNKIKDTSSYFYGSKTFEIMKRGTCDQGPTAVKPSPNSRPRISRKVRRG